VIDITGFQDIQPPPESLSVEVVMNPETAAFGVALYFEYSDEPKRIGYPIAVDVAEQVANYMLDKVREIREHQRQQR
jgi:hypothetical protein